MKFWSALFFTTFFLAGVERLQAPDEIKEAPSLADESKLEFWESQTLITKTVESKLSTDHSSTSTPSIIVSLSSSTLEQEQLVTPTEAPATPSYDIDSSLPFTNTASSSESLAQASRDVLSSVIFIPPSNPVQVQSPQESRDLGVDKENSASDTVHPTKEPEILSTALNSTPPTPISSEVTPFAPSTSTKKEEEDSITAALKQADEESTTKEEDMPSFDEFKRRVLQEEEEKSKQQNAESASGAVQKPKKVKERKQSNYASVDCGAKILEHNKEASNPESILVENKDLYMLNPCSAQVWFVVELCDVAHVKSIQIANFELFSSTPESFRVYVSKRYPTREWTMLGTFQAREEREVQTFPLDEPMYAKYFKVEMLSHFGSEHYCPLSLLRVYGSSMMEELEDHEIEGNEDNYNPDGDNEVPVLPPQPGANVDNKEPNLLERAADTVISLVKKFTGNGSDKENGTEVQEVANNESDVRESSNTEASGQNGSQDLSKGKLVTLVGHEDLNENTEEVAREKKDHSNKRNELQDKSAAVNVSDKHRSLCKVVDAQDKSTKTCLALTSREMFAHVIGRYCLGRCERRLHFSESAVEAAAKGRFKNIENCDNCDPNKNANDDETGVENRESKSKVTEPPHEEAVHKKASDVENLDEESRTSSEATNLKVSVKIPEPSSSDVELKRESTILRPVKSSETYTPSSRTVQPSQALDTSNKNEISDDKTPALEDTSLVTSMPSNSTQAASISQMLQSSELPKFTESHVDVLEGKPIPDAKKGNNEQQQSFPNSQTSVLEQELVESTRKSAQQSKVPSETKGDTSEGREEGVSKASDLEGKEKMEEHKSSVSSPEISAPNSIHVLSQSSPDIDVLETKLTDKDGREGTAQLPEELHVKDEKDPLENVEGTSPSKVVVGSSNVHVDSEQGTSKETTSSMSETEAFSREKVVSSSTVIQSQSVDSAIHPTSPPSVDTPDSPESVVPLPAPPVISPPPPVTADTSTSTLEVTSDPSDSSLDAAMLSKAQHSSSTSSSMASMAGSAGLHKESIFVRLSNKIKALEQNLNMSTLYMEQLNQRYRKSLDELQRNSDKKVALLTNATKKAEALMNSQKEQISHLQAQLDNLTNAMADMAARMGRLKKEVVERHVIGLCIELIAILVLFVVFARRRNTQERSSTLQRPGYYMNGHGPPTLAIEDSNHNKNKEIDPTILSGKEELLRSFGNTPTAETIGAITVTDSLDNITKEDSFNPNESKKRRNRKSKASNNHKPSLDSSCGDTSNKEPSPDSDRAPSPASLVSRTAGLLFFGARGFFGGFQIPWSQKKPRTVRSDPNITARSVMNQGDTASVKPKKTGITRAKSLELIPEEPTLNRHVPASTSPLPTEIGVMFKRPPDCYYSKKGIVKNVSTNPFKFGKYGVLDTQMA